MEGQTFKEVFLNKTLVSIIEIKYGTEQKNDTTLKFIRSINVYYFTPSALSNYGVLGSP